MVFVSAVWSAVLSAFVRAVCGLVRWFYAVVFTPLFEVSKWVFGSVVLEGVQVVHVIICKCVVQGGVAL